MFNSWSQYAPSRCMHTQLLAETTRICITTTSYKVLEYRNDCIAIHPGFDKLITSSMAAFENKALLDMEAAVIPLDGFYVKSVVKSIIKD
jgi:hypothetical protein